jgi:hypothetical protein
VEELFSIVNKLSGVSFATLLALVLFMQWKDYWGWSRDRHAVEKDRDEWKALALTNLGIAKQAIDHATKSQSRPPSVSE